MATCPRRRVTRVLPVAALLLLASVVRGQDVDPTAALVARAGSYVREYEQRFTGIVGEEHQTQRIVTAAGATTKQRALVSDVLLVRVGDGTRFFRDVIAVDGKPVRDREERLHKLFVGTSRDAMKQVRAIVAESMRYDLGARGKSRLFELAGALMLPLAIVKPGTSDRFRFTSTDEGVTFGEVRSPTLFQYRRGMVAPRIQDMPLRGRLSIDAASGAIRSASLAVVVDTDLEGAVDVRYEEHTSLGVLVPAEMSESYRRSRKAGGERLEVSSDYSNFRRFEVTVDAQIELPK